MSAFLAGAGMMSRGARPSHRTRKPQVTPKPVRVTIERIGADGDGVGRMADDVAVYVPFTLPHEVALVEPLHARGDGWLARATAIERPSDARVTPPCGYFGNCGGCALQHWRDGDYAGWKLGLLEAALRRAGFPALSSIFMVHGRPDERRRLDFAVRRDRGRIILGLHAAGSDQVIDLETCCVVQPRLVAVLAELRSTLQGLAAVRREASLVINLLVNGPDVLLRTDAPLSLADRNALIAFARSQAAPRISWAVGAGVPEPVCVFSPPVAVLGGVEVRVPPGAFLQATAAGEAAIVDAVLAGLPVATSRTRIAELYAGCGTLTFALARHARVAAWEGDAAAVAALQDAVRRTGLGGRIEAVQRDLVRQPLSVKELTGFAAVVLDPPHAGAAAQIPPIAAAGVPVVIYVSCNPAALSRDTRALQAASYTLTAATAIDQFLWSARLESVCVFRRDALAASRSSAYV